MLHALDSTVIAVDGGMLIQQRSATVDIFSLDRFPTKASLEGTTFSFDDL